MGASPVYFTSQEGHPDVVDLLVQAGADIHLATTEVHVSTHTVSSSVRYHSVSEGRMKYSTAGLLLRNEACLDTCY